MARRASNPPTRDLHDMTKTWSRGTGGRDAAPSEARTALKYHELCDMVDGKVHTKKTVDYSDAHPSKYPAGLDPREKWGPTCGECFVQRSRNGDCMC